MFKSILSIFVLLVSQQTFASDMQSDVRCFSEQDESVTFEVFADVSHQGDARETPLIVIESNGKETSAKLKSVSGRHGSLVQLQLADGRLIKINQNGGPNNTLNATRYWCSNPLSFLY